MHFFGTLGTIMFTVGILFTIYLGYNKLFIDTSSRLITSKPEFYIALITIVLGAQFFIAGFLAEIIIKFNISKNKYSIKKENFLDELLYKGSKIWSRLYLLWSIEYYI